MALQMLFCDSQETTSLASMYDQCLLHLRFRSEVNSMDDWTIENTPASVVKIGAVNLSAAISSQRDEKDKPVYWVAPKAYLGKKVCIMSSNPIYLSIYFFTAFLVG